MEYDVIDEPYSFLELDDETRGYMLAELEQDIATHGHPYRGKGTLTERGLEDYAALLANALSNGDETDLVTALKEYGRLASSAADAARKLGRTEFNRYYIRGVCRRAAAHGTNTVVVYRAHGSVVRRESSKELEDNEQSAPRILANLRGNFLDPESGLGRVNSGLSVRCGCTSGEEQR